MLLTHTSSLDIEPNWFYSVNYSSYDIPPLKNWIKSYFYENDEPREDIWMNRKPGSTFKYSNLGFCVIGYLVEKISGKNLNDYCKENIFQPLEMFNTSFNLSDFELDNVATPYMLAYRNLRGESLDIYLPLPHYSVIPYPAYGLRTTVEDLF